MSSVRKVLVVGGGFSGMCAAIQFRKYKIDVTLIEIDADWRSYGAGISLNAATLRAFGAIGVLPEVLEQGGGSDNVDLYLANGRAIGQIPTRRVAGREIPGGAGIMRPVLARILAQATLRAGIQVRLGCTFKSLDEGDEQVHVRFTDGSIDAYDLVVGADGLMSEVRRRVVPNAPKPRYTGQGVWRAVAPRPAEIQRTSMFMGQRLKAGLNPTSRDQMYLFLTEERPVREYVPDDQLQRQLAALLDQFPAPVLQALRAGLGPTSQILYRPLDALLVPPPWYRGRIVLIGDAAHATTPHLASGAGIGVEDAIVLAEELAGAATVGAALGRFQERRWERCRMVVESSLRLGEIEATGGSQEEHANIMREAMLTLEQPI